MRRLVLLIVLACSAVPPAFAQATQPPATTEPATSAPGRQIHVEEPDVGRSGFWTSRKAAKGGAYRWRLLGIGVGLVLITGFFTLRLIKNSKK